MNVAACARIFLISLLTLLLAGCEMPRLQPPPEMPRIGTLHEVAARGDLDGLRALVDAGADVTEADAEGLTPLHAAAFGGHVPALEYLLEHGARLNVRDQFGFTPLHAAARDGRLPAAEFLIARGADIAALDETGLTPEQAARFMGHDAVADFLAAHRPAEALVETPSEPETPPPPPSILWTGETFRVWTSLAGAQVEAEFVQNVLDTVLLRKRDGNLVRISIAQLKPEDQALVRQLSGHAAPALVRSRARATGVDRETADSTGLRIGRSGGWDLLENCRLLRRSGNDGDSFHVQHDGREYIFRLYYVDTPETNLSFPARVKEQAEYFNLDSNDMLRLGKEAGRFTERILSGGPFTVATKWEDARGNSRLPRHFAFVITSQGDLDERLMAEGYVRLYGMKIDGSLGSRKYQVLKKLEAEARRERVGVWGVGRKTASAAL